MKKIIFEQTGNIITTPLIAFAMIQSILLSPQSINKYKHITILSIFIIVMLTNMLTLVFLTYLIAWIIYERMT